jgi:hypothetical protein
LLPEHLLIERVDTTEYAARVESLALELQTSVKCVECATRTPLAGLRTQLACPGCAETLDLLAIQGGRTGGATHLFGGYHDAVTEALAHDGELHDTRGDLVAPLWLRKKVLACACGGALAVPESGRYAKCNACGDAVPVRWPDDATRAWDPRLHCIVGDASDRTPAKEPALAGADVCCKACGKALVRLGKRRALACEHCGAANFIGDAAWTALYPNPEDHAFFLVYKLDDRVLASVGKFLAGPHPGLSRTEAANLVAKLHKARLDNALAGHGAIDIELARELLARTDLTLHHLERIDGWLSNADRMVLAEQALPPGMLSRWAMSSDANTRAIADTARNGPKRGWAKPGRGDEAGEASPEHEPGRADEAAAKPEHESAGAGEAAVKPPHEAGGADEAAAVARAPGIGEAATAEQESAGAGDVGARGAEDQ